MRIKNKYANCEIKRDKFGNFNIHGQTIKARQHNVKALASNL